MSKRQQRRIRIATAVIGLGMVGCAVDGDQQADRVAGSTPSPKAGDSVLEEPSEGAVERVPSVDAYTDVSDAESALAAIGTCPASAPNAPVGRVSGRQPLAEHLEYSFEWVDMSAVAWERSPSYEDRVFGSGEFDVSRTSGGGQPQGGQTEAQEQIGTTGSRTLSTNTGVGYDLDLALTYGFEHVVGHRGDGRLVTGIVVAKTDEGTTVRWMGECKQGYNARFNEAVRAMGVESHDDVVELVTQLTVEPDEQVREQFIGILESLAPPKGERYPHLTIHEGIEHIDDAVAAMGACPETPPWAEYGIEQRPDRLEGKEEWIEVESLTPVDDQPAEREDDRLVVAGNVDFIADVTRGQARVDGDWGDRQHDDEGETGERQLRTSRTHFADLELARQLEMATFVAVTPSGASFGVAVADTPDGPHAVWTGSCHSYDVDALNATLDTMDADTFDEAIDLVRAVTVEPDEVRREEFSAVFDEHRSG